MPEPGGYITVEQLIARYGSDVKLTKLRDLEDGTGVKIQDGIFFEAGDGVYGIVIQSSLRGDVELAILKHQQLAGAAGSYTEVAKWTPGLGAQGLLQWISLASDLPDDTEWQLEIGKDTIFTDLKLQNVYNIEFKGSEGNGLKITTGETVKLSYKSGAVVVTVDGTIEGVEVQ